MLVSYTDELDYEPKVHMFMPCTISGKTKLTLTRWPEHCKDVHVLLNSERLMTACEPTDSLYKSYVAKVGQPPATTKTRPVQLTEQTDEYEPDYIEE